MTEMPRTQLCYETPKTKTLFQLHIKSYVIIVASDSRGNVFVDVVTQLKN